MVQMSGHNTRSKPSRAIRGSSTESNGIQDAKEEPFQAAFWRCNISGCQNVRLPTSDELEVHMVQHAVDFPSQCRMCFSRFVGDSGLGVHIKQKHLQIKQDVSVVSGLNDLGTSSAALDFPEPNNNELSLGLGPVSMDASPAVPSGSSSKKKSISRKSITSATASELARSRPTSRKKTSPIRQRKRVTRHCFICNRTFKTGKEWRSHAIIDHIYQKNPYPEIEMNYVDVQTLMRKTNEHSTAASFITTTRTNEEGTAVKEKLKLTFCREKGSYVVKKPSISDDLEDTSAGSRVISSPRMECVVDTLSNSNSVLESILGPCEIRTRIQSGQSATNTEAVTSQTLPGQSPDVDKENRLEFESPRLRTGERVATSGTVVYLGSSSSESERALANTGDSHMVIIQNDILHIGAEADQENIQRLTAATSGNSFRGIDYSAPGPASKPLHNNSDLGAKVNETDSNPDILTSRPLPIPPNELITMIAEEIPAKSHSLLDPPAHEKDPELEPIQIQIQVAPPSSNAISLKQLLLNRTAQLEAGENSPPNMTGSNSASNSPTPREENVRTTPPSAETQAQRDSSEDERELHIVQSDPITTPEPEPSETIPEGHGESETGSPQEEQETILGDLHSDDNEDRPTGQTELEDFRCPVCFQLFTSDDELEEHFSSTHFRVGGGSNIMEPESPYPVSREREDLLIERQAASITRTYSAEEPVSQIRSYSAEDHRTATGSVTRASSADGHISGHHEEEAQMLAQIRRASGPEASIAAIHDYRALEALRNQAHFNAQQQHAATSHVPNSSQAQAAPYHHSQILQQQAMNLRNMGPSRPQLSSAPPGYIISRPANSQGSNLLSQAMLTPQQQLQQRSAQYAAGMQGQSHGNPNYPSTLQGALNHNSTSQRPQHPGIVRQHSQDSDGPRIVEVSSICQPTHFPARYTQAQLIQQQQHQQQMQQQRSHLQAMAHKQRQEYRDQQVQQQRLQQHLQQQQLQQQNRGYAPRQPQQMTLQQQQQMQHLHNQQQQQHIQSQHHSQLRLSNVRGSFTGSPQPVSEKRPSVEMLQHPNAKQPRLDNMSHIRPRPPLMPNPNLTQQQHQSSSLPLSLPLDRSVVNAIGSVGAGQVGSVRLGNAITLSVCPTPENQHGNSSNVVITSANPQHSLQRRQESPGAINTSSVTSALAVRGVTVTPASASQASSNEANIPSHRLPVNVSISPNPSDPVSVIQRAVQSPRQGSPLSASGSPPVNNHQFTVPQGPAPRIVSTMSLQQLDRPDRPPTVDLTLEDGHSHTRPPPNLLDSRGVRTVIPQGQAPPTRPARPAVSCNLCGVLFGSLPALEEHKLHRHGIRVARAQVQQPPTNASVNRLGPAQNPSHVQVPVHRPAPPQVQPSAQSSATSRYLYIPLLDISRMDPLKLRRLEELGICSMVPLHGNERAAGQMGIPVMSLRSNGMGQNMPWDSVLPVGPVHSPAQLSGNTEVLISRTPGGATIQHHPQSHRSQPQ